MEGARGAAALPPGPVEPGTLSLWMDLFSLDSVIFYFDYSDLQLFAIFIFEVDFSETYLMTSAENSVLEPPNLKILGGGYPQTPPKRLLPSALAIMPPPPVTKNLTTDLPIIFFLSQTPLTQTNM